MATDSLQKAASGATGGTTDVFEWIYRAGKHVLSAVASLKLTVVLLSLSIVIVLFGTLAQARKDMWDVIADYFDAWVAQVPVEDLLPPAWFPRARTNLRFYFFGGKLIGCLMMANLIAAHLVRFRAQARGQRLLIGLAALGVGVVLTTWVIVSGHNHAGLQGTPPFSWSTLWTLMRLGLLGLLGGGIYGLVALDRQRRAERILLWTGNGLLAATIVMLFLPGASSFLGDAGMRILWQLLQASFAGGLLLAGCLVLFGKRGGVVLLHGGVGLLMFGQLLASLFAVEERMTIREGETVDYVQDIRAVELAVTDPSNPEQDTVVAVPLTEKGKATRFGDKRKAARSPESKLPFDIEVVEFFKNSTALQPVKAGDSNLATAGIGLSYKVGALPQNTGASSAGSVDVAAAYVRFTATDSGADLGTYLFSQVLSEQHYVEKIAVGGQTYEVTLRFKRSYKPYSIALTDVRKDDYPGTTIPRNYSSDIRLNDPTRSFDDAIHIRMNEPLRYAGETFYQSGYRVDEDGTEITDLQVVTNTGWMIPYVACMIVVIGMLYHFGQTLVRFLQRMTAAEAQRDSAAAAARQDAATADRGKGRSGKVAGRAPATEGSQPAALPWTSWRRWLVPAVVVGVFVVIVAYKGRTPTPDRGGFDLARFGRLPVLEKGRVKPLDTLARNTMRVLSNRETFKDADGRTQPAIRWLIDMITEKTRGTDDEGQPAIAAHDYRVFRIENDDVLNLLGLERRPGLRYSVNELLRKIHDFEKKVEEARERKAEDLTTYERKLVELDGRVRTFTLVKACFSPLNLPPLPSEAEFRQDPVAARAKLDAIKRVLLQIPEADRQLARMQPPRAIPFPREDGQWQPYATAWNFDYLQRALGQQQEGNEAVEAFSRILAAYAADNPQQFNGALASYEALLRKLRPELYSASITAAESRFNQIAPFSWTTYLYVLAFTFTALAWLTWILGYYRTFNQIAFWIIVCTLIVHTAALAARVIISGRPPVTNLYSSAVFIGWGCVVFGVVLERLLPLGIGNIIASAAGFVTLVIAEKLALDGETMAVMQAVLDTQFWLSTHVVCITLGYSATYVAGLLGIVYLGARFVPGVLDVPVAHRQGSPLRLGTALTTMTYGVVCFAIFFSFWGTVLGGLWADDSWGRFWGWDPKENGALIIVLWNALVLHARWDRQVADRGLAMLAVGGNIVTSWSWFGVNELGVGLHSYGFTEGVLFTLGVVVVAHLAVVASGWIPAPRGKPPTAQPAS
ncbi:MAG: cytochrome c biogenesis protein CcsA [Pirellulales bacterium]